MKVNRLLVLALMLVTVVAFSACGGDSDAPKDDGDAGGGSADTVHYKCAMDG